MGRRELAEEGLLNLIINKPNVLDLLQVKPMYFKNEIYKLMLEAFVDCYKKYNVIDIARLVDYNVDIDIYTHLMVSEINRSDYISQLNNLEDIILSEYKTDVIKEYGLKLEMKLITSTEYLNTMSRIKDINFSNKTETLNIQEILDSINVHNAKIKIKGYEKLNNTLQLVRGDLLVVGATTGMGKSGLLLNFFDGLAEEYQCIYFNMEMSKSTIYKRLISIKSGIPLHCIDNPNEYQAKRINYAIEFMASNKSIIEHKANDIYKIKSMVAKLKNKDKHTIVFIDHLGLTKAEGNKSIYEQTTEVAKQLRQICLEYDCTIISAAQLNRTAYHSEDITLNMLKDSGELENSASKIILLYKDKDEAKDTIEPTMFAEIAKNRDGLTGIIKMKYFKDKQIFKEVL